MTILGTCHDIFYGAHNGISQHCFCEQGIGLKKCQHVMEHIFLAKLDGSSQYNELRISEGFSKWFECKISTSTTNLL
jgi:hypothetical protein